jgi:hypothetical protein
MSAFGVKRTLIGRRRKATEQRAIEAIAGAAELVRRGKGNRAKIYTIARLKPCHRAALK